MSTRGVPISVFPSSHSRLGKVPPEPREQRIKQRAVYGNIQHRVGEAHVMFAVLLNTRGRIRCTEGEDVEPAVRSARRSFVFVGETLPGELGTEGGVADDKKGDFREKPVTGSCDG